MQALAVLGPRSSTDSQTCTSTASLADFCLCPGPGSAEGLSKEGYDEVSMWLKQPSTLNNVQVVFLQETWRSTSEFSTAQALDSVWRWYVWQGQQWSGVAVLINSKLGVDSGASPRGLNLREQAIPATTSTFDWLLERGSLESRGFGAPLKYVAPEGSLEEALQGEPYLEVHGT